MKFNIHELWNDEINDTDEWNYAWTRERERGGFLKIIPISILTYAGMKTGFHVNISPREIGFCADVGRNADWNNL